MRYTITFPIAVFQKDAFTYDVPIGLYRDIGTQLRFTDVRIVCMMSKAPLRSKDVTSVDLRDYPNLSIRILPYVGGFKRFLLGYAAIRSVLVEEARQSDVWHTGCSTGVFDLTTLSYEVGRRHARGLRVFCLDSDPASMVEKSRGLFSVVKGRLLRRNFIRRVRAADLTILNGKGVEQAYMAYARNHVTTEAVWLLEGDLAGEAETAEKYAAPGAVRIVLPSRFMPWKGIDDALEALALLGDRVGPHDLDIIGEGQDKDHLVKLAAKLGLDNRVRFLAPIPYGAPFFKFLRGYHLVLVPTRGLEDARIVYDAAASGCVLVHSNTKTIEYSAGVLPMKWSFQPGTPSSLADALTDAIAHRSIWAKAAIEGIQTMKGRTIHHMHQIRNEAIERLRTNRPLPVNPKP
jgi:glycosyltransferase involved in cell wall biosynthesis